MATTTIMNLGNIGQSVKTPTPAKSGGTKYDAGGKSGNDFDSALKSAQSDGAPVAKDIKDVAKEVAQEDLNASNVSSADQSTTAQSGEATANDAPKADTAEKPAPQGQGETKITVDNSLPIVVVEPPKEDAPETTELADAETTLPTIPVLNLLADEDTPLPIDDQITTSEEQTNLFSVLPQDKNAARQNQRMLAMLSGRFIEQTTVEPTEGETVLPQTQQPRDILSMQTKMMAQNAASAVLSAMPQPDKPLQGVQNLGAAVEKIFMPTENIDLPLDKMPRIAMAISEREMSQMPQIMRQISADVNVSLNISMTQTVRQSMPMATTNAPVSTSDVANMLGDATLNIEDAMNPFDGLMRDMANNERGGERQPQQNLGQQNLSPNIVEEVRTQSERNFVNEVADNRSTESGGNVGNNNASTQTAPTFHQTLQSVEGNRETNTPQNPQNVRDDYNVRQQIVEQARMIRSQESTEMVIKLRPEHLGELTLRVSVTSNGAVNASFHTPNAEVRAIIENSLVQLKQELNNQGLKVEDVEVYAGLADGQLPSRDGQAWQQGRGQNANAGGSNAKIDMENFEETNDAITPTRNADGKLIEGVDYRV